MEPLHLQLWLNESPFCLLNTVFFYIHLFYLEKVILQCALKYTYIFRSIHPNPAINGLHADAYINLNCLVYNFPTYAHQKNNYLH